MAAKERMLMPEDRIYDLVDLVEEESDVNYCKGFNDDIRKMVTETAEKIARELIPDIAERVIREEIEKLKSEGERVS